MAFAPHAIMYRFESDSLEQLDNSWKGLGQRNLLDKALEIIQFANMSLWMAKPTTANYERVVTFEISDTPNIKSTVVPLGCLCPHTSYAADLHDKSNLDLASVFMKALLTLSPKTALWVAQYSLWTALIQRTWEVRYLTLWTGLEGLLTGGSPGDNS